MKYHFPGNYEFYDTIFLEIMNSWNKSDLCTLILPYQINTNLTIINTVAHNKVSCASSINLVM